MKARKDRITRKEIEKMTLDRYLAYRESMTLHQYLNYKAAMKNS